MNKTTYTSFKICGELRHMLNQSHNLKALTPKLCNYIKLRIKHEADFHDEEWMKNVLNDLEKLVIEVPTKHLRFDKFLESLWKWKVYPLEKVVSIVDTARQGKHSWEPHYVDFSEKDNITMNFKEKGHTGLLRRVSVITESTSFVELKFDEYLNGASTGETILVTYDTSANTRWLCNFGQAKRRIAEEFRSC